MKLECDALRRIGAISRSIQKMYDSELRSNLERGQFVFLTRVCENEGINPIELSNLLKVDKATTTKAITKMEAKGLIEKRRDLTDGRVWRLYPTRAALELYARIISEENEYLSICFSGFSAEEKESARALINRMEANMARRWKDFRRGTSQPINAEGGGSHVVRVDVYSSEHRQAVIDMVLSIQQGEFGLPISIGDQPDLNDIEGFFLKRGNFWVAYDSGSVVGTIGVIDIGRGNAALRKMFVRKEYRGKGVSKELLAQLLKWAAGKGFRNVYLGTTPLFLAAHRFYEKNDFVEISRDELPDGFPVMEVDKKFYRHTIV